MHTHTHTHHHPASERWGREGKGHSLRCRQPPDLGAGYDGTPEDGSQLRETVEVPRWRAAAAAAAALHARTLHSTCDCELRWKEVWSRVLVHVQVVRLPGAGKGEGEGEVRPARCWSAVVQAPFHACTVSPRPFLSLYGLAPMLHSLVNHHRLARIFSSQSKRQAPPPCRSGSSSCSLRRAIASGRGSTTSARHGGTSTTTWPTMGWGGRWTPCRRTAG